MTGGLHPAWCCCSVQESERDQALSRGLPSAVTAAVEQWALLLLHCVLDTTYVQVAPTANANAANDKTANDVAGAMQMNVTDVEAELKRAMQLQTTTSEALSQAVRDKLQAEAELTTAMVRGAGRECDKSCMPQECW